MKEYGNQIIWNKPKEKHENNVNNPNNNGCTNRYTITHELEFITISKTVIYIKHHRDTCNRHAKIE